MLNQILKRETSLVPAIKSGLNLNEWEPICQLPIRYQDEILNRSHVADYEAGDIIFMLKDNDEKDYYLLKGSVELVNDRAERVALVENLDHKSLQLIDHHRPRIYTARAKQDCQIFVTRRTFYESLNTANTGAQELPQMEVDEMDFDTSGNWMLHMLNSGVFSNLPPENLQQIFIHMESIDISRDQLIIEQGTKSKYFYLIQQGSGVVTHQPEGSHEHKTLTTLTTGDTFGERALITNACSDVTVKMLTDGVVMRMSEASFNELVKKPLLHSVRMEQATTLIKKGAHWLDVRDPAAYRDSAIKNSINLDLERIYTAAQGLNRDDSYIICGDSELQAQAGAFLLAGKGYQVYYLTVPVVEYLSANQDMHLSHDERNKAEAPLLTLETTLEEGTTDVLADIVEATADEPPQFRINTAAVNQSMQNIARDLELQIRKELHDLYILKQKEFEHEANERFKKYHLVTARLMKKKLDDLELVYKTQARMVKK